MQTLTITTAKKNLGRWLAAAARGEEIAIVCGADIIALRKVEVEAASYAFQEYGITPAEIARFEKRMAKRRPGGVVVRSAAELRKVIAMNKKAKGSKIKS
jgi:antitoxin (DNA-binding transcriptional repressor) of toxin-antitoxin stability system